MYCDCTLNLILSLHSDHFRMRESGAGARKHRIHKKYIIDVLLTGKHMKWKRDNAKSDISDRTQIADMCHFLGFDRTKGKPPPPKRTQSLTKGFLCW